ncbi:MAG: ATP-binding protein [Nocardiopsaceae bacterium]|nr:ATP-binding protein [Nocardiopsaceae bacterium]
MSLLSSFSPVRWEPRVYRGSLELAGRVRSHVRADLAAFPDELACDVELCASELFANACEYTASGGQDGEVVRTLRLPGEDRLRLEVTDGGFTDTRPTIPDLTGTDWFTCERHRGLLMVAALALDWGFYPVLAHPTLNLGLVVWADFALAPGQAPTGLPRFVHTA